MDVKPRGLCAPEHFESVPVRGLESCLLYGVGDGVMGASPPVPQKAVLLTALQ